jgi:hypothetical protein
MDGEYALAIKTTETKHGSLVLKIMNKYWVCIIGPVEDEKLPPGADLPPRKAAKRAVAEMLGYSCSEVSSGWCYQEEYDRIDKARHPALYDEQGTLIKTP